MRERSWTRLLAAFRSGCPSRASRTFGFVDMSGGSIDDATLGIAHRDKDGSVLLDRIVDQGQRPPFDPRKAVERFVAALKEYGLRSVVGDQYAGETFRARLSGQGDHLSGLGIHEVGNLRRDRAAAERRADRLAGSSEP